MKLPYEHARPAGEALADVNGNLALDQILGAQLEWQPDGTWDVLFQAAEALAGRLESQGKRVYRIPVGGSSPLGAYAFARAGEELVRQVKPDFLVTASSSGSTHTGLAAYFSGSKTQVIGIACDPEPEIVDDYSELSGQLAKLEPSLPALRPQDFRLESGYVGGGYGISSSSGNAAIETMARTEGIFLDPIYSGKAFAGLLDLAKKGVLRGTVVFWHTGGVPALFATEV
jgi:1-aminocyclopropane-1-carboxylate deaminase/D-cysteine desulfhydrase-like pyridoxal-dependent ACC family enzyme